MEGFFLGLSSGTSCIAHCAPVIVPYFLGEGDNTKINIVNLSGFLSGRLIGYLIFGVFAWIFGNIVSGHPALSNLIFGTSFILLSIFMAYTSLSTIKSKCAYLSIRGVANNVFKRKKYVTTIILGFLTGINFCPPFLLAFSTSAQDGTLVSSLQFFLTFFLGTVFYFLPMVFLGTLNRERNMSKLGKMISIIVAVYFFYKGSLMIGGLFA